MDQNTNGAGTKDWEEVSKSLQISSVFPSMYATLTVNTSGLGTSHPLIPATGVLPDDFMESVEEYRHQVDSSEKTSE
jgi:hypothetical protein